MNFTLHARYSKGSGGAGSSSDTPATKILGAFWDTSNSGWSGVESSSRTNPARFCSGDRIEVSKPTQPSTDISHTRNITYLLHRFVPLGLIEGHQRLLVSRHP